MTLAAWLCSAVTIVSSLVSLGFAVAGLRARNGTGHVSSEYALARSAALVVIAIVAPLTSDAGFIAAAAVAMICVQGLDAVIGARLGNRVKTVGPAATAATNAVAFVWLIVAL